MLCVSAGIQYEPLRSLLLLSGVRTVERLPLRYLPALGRAFEASNITHCFGRTQFQKILHDAFGEKDKRCCQIYVIQMCQTRFYLIYVQLRLIDAIDRRRTMHSVVRISDIDRNPYNEKRDRD